jgi:hypothetical protein
VTARRTLLALVLLSGCTVKLKIGAPELSKGGGVPVCRGPGEGCASPSDCCSQICGSTGCELPDAGDVLDAGGGGGRDAGNQEIGARCLAFTDCASGDCASAQCVDHQDWMCDRSLGFCDTDGGFCLSTDSACFAYTDCCNQDCDRGHCRFSSPLAWPPSQGDPDGGGCLLYGPCSSFFECCSGNCFQGACAAVLPFCLSNGSCVNYTDCCTFDCDHGQCRDSSTL